MAGVNPRAESMEAVSELWTEHCTRWCMISRLHRMSGRYPGGSIKKFANQHIFSTGMSAEFSLNLGGNTDNLSALN